MDYPLIKDAADTLWITRRTAMRRWLRYEEEGERGLLSRRGNSGRKKTTTEAEDDWGKCYLKRYLSKSHYWLMIHILSFQKNALITRIHIDNRANNGYVIVWCLMPILLALLVAGASFTPHGYLRNRWEQRFWDFPTHLFPYIMLQLWVKITSWGGFGTRFCYVFRWQFALPNTDMRSY